MATGVDLMVVTHGTGDFDMFLLDIANATVAVECLRNSTTSC